MIASGWLALCQVKRSKKNYSIIFVYCYSNCTNDHLIKIFASQHKNLLYDNIFFYKISKYVYFYKIFP